MMQIRFLAIAVLMLWIFIDGFVVFRYKTGEAENRDRFSLKIVMTGNLLALWTGIGLAFSPYGTLYSIPMQLLGLSLMLFGIILRSTAIAQLGRFHSPNVAIHADHRLIETGLYRYVRHPSYLGGLIAFLGFSFALANWLSILVMMTILPCVYLYRIHEEDNALLLAFGDSYRSYCQRTKRLIPWLY